MGAVACSFPRRETRSTFRQLAEGLLMELEDVSCWTLAEAIGHSGPHRLQHLLSRARWDDAAVLDAAAAWATSHLDDGDAVLIADETGDAKSSTDAVGASHQYSGSLGGVGLCQVAVHLTYATTRGHALIDRTGAGRGLAADAHRHGLQGRARLRLGDARGTGRRHPRRAGRERGLGTAGPPPSLHRHCLLLPLLEPGPGEPGETGGHRVS
jgi:hypothetical protein